MMYIILLMPLFSLFSRTVFTLTAAYLVYVQNEDGSTPLMLTANNGHARCIQLLVEYVPKVM